MGIGSNIRKLVKQRGENMVILSQRSKVPVQTIYTILKRDVIQIRQDTLYKLADALEVPPAVLLENNNYDPKPYLADSEKEHLTLPDHNEIFVPINHPDHKLLDKIDKMAEPGFVEEYCKAFDLTKEEVYNMLIGPHHDKDDANYQKKIDALESLTRYSAINMIFAEQTDLLIKCFKKLNYTGRREALKRMKELTQLREFTTKE